MPTQNFITVDSVLKLDSKWLSIQKIRKDPDQSYWLHSFLLLALFIAFQVHRTLNGEYFAWIIIVPALIWIFPHLERIYKWLFVYKWGSHIRLQDIREIRPMPVENEWERPVLLLMKSGRQKKLVFRTAENQYEAFVQALESELGAALLASGSV